jgi:hypothetical protein
MALQLNQLLINQCCYNGHPSDDYIVPHDYSNHSHVVFKLAACLVGIFNLVIISKDMVTVLKWYNDVRRTEPFPSSQKLPYTTSHSLLYCTTGLLESFHVVFIEEECLVAILTQVSVAKALIPPPVQVWFHGCTI